MVHHPSLNGNNLNSCLPIYRLLFTHQQPAFLLSYRYHVLFPILPCYCSIEQMEFNVTFFRQRILLVHSHFHQLSVQSQRIWFHPSTINDVHKSYETFEKKHRISVVFSALLFSRSHDIISGNGIITRQVFCSFLLISRAFADKFTKLTSMFRTSPFWAISCHIMFFLINSCPISYCIF